MVFGWVGHEKNTERGSDMIKLNRRNFMQVLGAIGIGGALPAGKAKAGPVVEPAIDKGWMSRDEVRQQEDYPGQSDPVQAGGRSTYTLKGAKLYCKKAGIKAELMSVTFQREPIEMTPTGVSWPQYVLEGPLVIDCEIQPVNIQRGKMEWCMFNVAEWVVILADKTMCSIKGHLTHPSFNADAYNPDRDTMSLTIQEV